MRRLSHFLIPIILLSTLFSRVPPSYGLYKPENGDLLSVISTEEDGILVNFFAPDIQIETHLINNSPCKVIRLGNGNQWTNQLESGLPGSSILLGVPTGMDYSVEVISQKQTRIEFNGDFCLPEAELINESTESEFLSSQNSFSSVSKSFDEITTAPLVAITQQGFIRYQPVIQLQVSPLQLDSLTKNLLISQSMQIKISFSQSRNSSGNLQRSNLEDGFGSTLQTIVSNYMDAQRWQEIPSGNLVPLLYTSAPNEVAYNITVNQSGVYLLSYDTLQAAGLPVDSILPDGIHISKKGQEIPIIVNCQQTNTFSPGDTILFYGEIEKSKYYNSEIYRLTWDENHGARITTDLVSDFVNPQPTTSPFHTTLVHYENNLLYQTKYPSGIDNDHWYWKYFIFTGTPTSFSTPINISNLADGDETTATLSGLFKGYAASPFHHTNIFINDHLIDSKYWDVQDELQFETTFPSTYLLNGENTIKVEAPGNEEISLDSFLINWFELEYPATYYAENDRFIFNSTSGTWRYQIGNFSNNQIEVFDITDPLNPSKIQGGAISQSGLTYNISFSQTDQAIRRYLVETASQRINPASITLSRNDELLHSSNNGADYIIITHDNFLSAARELANYRADQGLRTKVVTIREIYDQFSYGNENPEAIQEFLKYAFFNWQPPAPLYVVLLGDGNYDYQNFLNRNEPNYIPPFLADIDPWIGETAIDSRLAAVNGEDILPDLYIGRLPVKTISEANAVVNKIILYESQPITEWNRQTVFIADNTDDAGNFSNSNTVIGALLPLSFSKNFINYIDPVTTPVSAIRSSIISNINAGKGLLMYSGHGSIQFWADENLFSRNNISSLSSSTMFPFWVTLTCLDGYFIHPSPSTANYSSLSELIMRAPDRGAIAAFSPTGWGLVSGHEILATGLFKALFDYGINRAGAATTYAKYYLASQTSGHQELIDTYTLFGDPALQLKLGPDSLPNEPDLSLQLSLPNGPGKPGEWVDLQVDYTNQGGSLAENIAIDLPLPSQLISPTITSSPTLIQRAGSSYSFSLLNLAPGQSGRLTIHAQIDPASLGKFPVSAAISSGSADADPGNNQASINVSVDPLPGLSLSLTSPTTQPLNPGDALELHLNYSNNGAGAASDVSLNFLLPDALVSPAVILPSGWATLGAIPYTFTLPTLQPGEYGAIVINTTIDPQFDGALNLSAELTSSAQDEDPTDNHASLAIVVTPPADLELQSSLLPEGILNSGDPVTITLAYANKGQLNAENVQINLTYPSGLRNILVTPPAGWESTDAPNTYSIAELTPGSQGVFTINASVDAGFSGWMHLTATITTTSLERPVANNTAIQYLGTIPPPDLKVSISTLSTAPYEPGHPIQFQVDYANQGQGETPNVVLSFPIPTALLDPQLTLPPGSGWTDIGSSPYTLMLPSLPPGEGGSIFIDATLNPSFSGELSLTPSIASDAPDGNLDDNTATLSLVVSPPSDLELQFTQLSTPPVYRGKPIEVHLNYANKGGSTAENVSVVLKLPDHIHNVQIVPPPGWTVSSMPDTYEISALPPAGSGAWIIQAQVDEDYIGQLPFSASINTTSPEGDGDNNQAELWLESLYRYLIPMMLGGQ